MKRRCPCCNEWLELSTANFFRATRETSGYDRYCKGCRRVINRPGQQRWMENNREKHCAQSNNYRKRQKEMA